MSKVIEIKEMDWVGLSAYTLLVGYIVIIGITAAKSDLETMATVAAILGPFVGVVVTFLFGIKKLEKFIRKVELLTK